MTHHTVVYYGGAPAVLVADHRPILPRDVLVGAQLAQCVVRIVVVMPVLVAVVPAPALQGRCMHVPCTPCTHHAHAHTIAHACTYHRTNHHTCQSMSMSMSMFHVILCIRCPISKKRVRSGACSKHAPPHDMHMHMHMHMHSACMYAMPMCMHIVESPVRRVSSGCCAATSTTQVELLPLVRKAVLGAEPPPPGSVRTLGWRGERRTRVANRVEFAVVIREECGVPTHCTCRVVHAHAMHLQGTLARSRTAPQSQKARSRCCALAS